MDSQGNVYVVDVVLSLDGTAIEKERIVKFDAKGRYCSTVCQIEYEEGNRPLTTGRIQGMALMEDGIYFVYNERDRLSLQKISADGKIIKFMQLLKQLISLKLKTTERRRPSIKARNTTVMSFSASRGRL